MADTNKHHQPDAKPGILRNLKIARIALVDMGANFDKRTGDGAHIMLWKRAEPVAKNPTVASVHAPAPPLVDGDPKNKDKKKKPAIKRVAPDHPDYDQYETDYEKGNLDAESRRALPDSAFAAVWTDSKGKKHRKLPIHDAGHLAAARGRLNAAKVPSDVKARARARIDAATRRTHKEKRQMKDILKRLVGLLKEDDATKRATGLAEIETLVAKADDGDEDDKVHKADDPMCKCDSCVSMRAPMPPAFTKRFEALEKAANDAIAKAAAAEARANASETLAKGVVLKAEKMEMRTLLKSFNSVPFDLSNDTEVDAFLVMKAANQPAFDAMIAKYRALDAQLEKSALFGDFGSGRSDVSGEGSAWAQIEAKADALVGKSAEGLTKEQRIEKVMLDPANNHLVRQYRAEQQ